MLAKAYEPRRPEETVLYKLVRSNLDAFLRHARDNYDKPLPEYVERELARYLECGIFANGFAHCHCESCGHDRLVAFSCKGRGICPSCATRRMTNTAAHLADAVVPDVPVRQFVLSLPFELRKLLAFRADVLTAASRIFTESVMGLLRRKCGPTQGEPGAVMFVQRFGGSLNLNVHFHLVAMDGVFYEEADELLFRQAPAPTQAELGALVERTEKRIIKWLKRKGLLDEGESAVSERTALEACADAAMSRGTFGNTLERFHTNDNTDEETALEKRRFTAERNGFSLHAGVRMEAGDDVGRERLFRYGARPSLSLERISVMRDSLIAYRVKYPRKAEATHRLMTPLEFMARLAALIPPPRYPLVRYAGVLGPNSPWRKRVVPKPRAAISEGHKHGTSPSNTLASPKEGLFGPPAKGGSGPQTIHPPQKAAVAVVEIAAKRGPAQELVTLSSSAHNGDPRVIRLGPNVLSVKHWERIEQGLLLASAPRPHWARLLKRSLDVDALDCPKCHGRLRVVGVIDDRQVAKEICARLGLPERAPPRTSAQAADVELQLSIAW